jgi:hypothetical protein
VPAPELEAVVADAIRRHLQGSRTDPIPETDRELIERHLLRVTLGTKELMLHLRRDAAGNDPAGGDDDPILSDAATPPVTIAIPWTAPTAPPTKGISYVPAHNTPMKPGSRQLVLIAIAKARKWMKDVERGQSFADIARREGKAEQHIRNLAPLAFVSPRIITAIMEGTAPAGLTATALTRGLPYSWTEQEQRMSMPQRLDWYGSQWKIRKRVLAAAEPRAGDRAEGLSTLKTAFAARSATIGE